MPVHRSCSHTPTTAPPGTAAICGWIPDPTVNVSVVPVGTVLPQVEDSGLEPDTWAVTGEVDGDDEPELLVPPPQSDSNAAASTNPVIEEARRKSVMPGF